MYILFHYNPTFVRSELLPEPLILELKLCSWEISICHHINSWRPDISVYGATRRCKVYKHHNVFTFGKTKHINPDKHYLLYNVLHVDIPIHNRTRSSKALSHNDKFRISHNCDQSKTLWNICQPFYIWIYIFDVNILFFTML